MKKILIGLICVILVLSGCSSELSKTADLGGVQINLSDSEITVDGVKIGNDSTAAVYAANDIVFYLADQGFTYGEGEKQDEHTESEADAHTVVHITKPGRYVLSGKISAGQIAVDLGKDAKKDEGAVVTLVLNNLDITCTVAPAVIFYNVYECGNKDEKSATKDVDTSKAGANVIIADGTVNTVNGSYVAKIYKSESVKLNEAGTEVEDADKLHKYDAAFYSKMSMNVDGNTGVLNINAENEGLDSELHLTLNGGTVNINAGNDGINTNEDGVSVTTINGGALNILCNGKTGEGDGIDSNGWLVINSGSVNAQACSSSADSGIDSDMGIYINGGKVLASGNMLDRISGGNATFAVFSFSTRQPGNSVYVLKDNNGKEVGHYAPDNAFTYLLIAGDELKEGDYTFWQGENQLAASGSSGGFGGRPQMPQGGMKPSEIPNGGKPNGEFPQMPDGEMPQIPDGEIPQMPSGEIPDFDGAMNMPTGELSTKFTIVKGENQFSLVSPVEKNK